MTRRSNHPPPLHDQMRAAARRRTRRAMLLAAPGLGIAALAGVAQAGWLRARFDLDGIEMLLVQLVSSVAVYSAVSVVVGWFASRGERRAPVETPRA